MPKPGFSSTWCVSLILTLQAYIKQCDTVSWRLRPKAGILYLAGSLCPNANSKGASLNPERSGYLLTSEKLLSSPAENQ